MLQIFFPFRFFPSINKLSDLHSLCTLLLIFYVLNCILRVCKPTVAAVYQRIVYKNLPMLSYHLVIGPPLPVPVELCIGKQGRTCIINYPYLFVHYLIENKSYKLNLRSVIYSLLRVDIYVDTVCRHDE